MKQKGKMYVQRRNQKHMQQKARNKAYIDALNKVMIISLSDKNGGMGWKESGVTFYGQEM